VYAASLGGGLVDGDHVDLHVNVAEDAWLTLATQASTKVYRSDAHGTSQTLFAEVAQRGVLVCLPDPVVPFAGARYKQRATLKLAPDSSLVWLDGVTCGRRLSRERWSFAHYSSRIVVESAAGGTTQTPGVESAASTVRDHTLLDPAHGALAERMGRYGALATLIVLGPAFTEIAASMTDHGQKAHADLIASVSPIRGGVIVRMAGSSAETVARGAGSLLESLPSLLGDDPTARRW
jgi:urease accessory protein